MLTLAIVGQVDVFIIFLQHAIPVAIHTTTIACFLCLIYPGEMKKQQNQELLQMFCALNLH